MILAGSMPFFNEVMLFGGFCVGEFHPEVVFSLC